MKTQRQFALVWDLAILGVLGAACAGAYFLWIEPDLARAKDKEVSRQICRAQEKSYQAARMNHFRIRHEVQDLLEQVHREGGGMPAESMTNHRIATITAIAQDSGVVVEEVDPAQSDPVEEHLESLVRFRARTTYLGFRRFLHQVEQQMPFMDITHFSVQASSGRKGGACRVEWWVRLYSQEDSLAEGDPDDQMPGGSSRDGRDG